MNLPIILDVAIVLIITYLILSLLASEIQENIATLFQWRAKHLKESIENLLAGPSEKSQNVRKNKVASSAEAEQIKVRQLVEELYDDPLIKNVNQEAKGSIENFPRRLTWFFAEGVFGRNKHSGPSYLNSETFATSLLERLNILSINQKLSVSRLETFKEEQLAKIEKIQTKFDLRVSQDTKSLLNEELKQLEQGFEKIVENFKTNQFSIDTIIEQIEAILSSYIENSKSYLPEETAFNFEKQMQALMQETFSGNFGKRVLLSRLKPSLTDLAAEIENDPALPQTIRESLAILARRAQARVQRGEEDINQLRQEVAVWYERSMNRASGVYKRNAKLVAFLLGLVVAVASNSDTFHIASRASQEQVIRDSAFEYADARIPQCSNEQSPIGGTEPVTGDTETAAEATEPAVEGTESATGDNQSFRDCITKGIGDELTLPIGWLSDGSLKQQGLKDYELNEQQSPGVPRHVRIIWTLLGWILSAIAISMGAPFWFDLLSKVMHVRNTGKRETSTTPQPSSYTEEQQE